MTSYDIFPNKASYQGKHDFNIKQRQQKLQLFYAKFHCLMISRYKKK